MFALARSVRARIAGTFYRKCIPKTSKARDILGCDYDFLVNYLKMTYLGNYGYHRMEDIEVHIDHVVPTAVAQTEADIIYLNHYSNLQWLIPIDNLQKNNKIDDTNKHAYELFLINKGAIDL